MGLDFLAKAGPSFKKGWRHGLGVLMTPDLFTKRPTHSVWVTTIRLSGAAAVSEGGMYALRSSSDSVAAYDNRDQLLGKDECPPPGLTQLIRGRGGMALGKVRKIREGLVDLDVVVDD